MEKEIKIIFLIFVFLISSNYSNNKRICLREYSIKQSWLERFLSKKVSELKDNEILLLSFSTAKSFMDLIDTTTIIDSTREDIFINDTTKESFEKFSTDTIFYGKEYDTNEIKSIVLIKIERDKLDWYSKKSGIIKVENNIIIILGILPDKFLKYNGRDTCFNIPEKNIFIIYEPRQDYYLIKDTTLIYTFSL